MTELNTNPDQPSEARASSAPHFERVLFVILGLVGLGAVIISSDYGDGTLHGGDLLPKGAGGLLFIISIFCLFEKAGSSTPDSGAIIRVGSALILTICFLVLMPSVGFPITSPLWLAGFMLLLGEKRLQVIIPVSLILPGIAWLLLEELAHAPPPYGILLDYILE